MIVGILKEIKVEENRVAMTPADVTKLEGSGEIGPRVSREEWVVQAQELLAGKPPRAKTDRDRA